MADTYSNFKVKTVDPYVTLYANATDELARRAGVKTSPIKVRAMSDMNLPEWLLKRVGGGYSHSGKEISLNNVVVPSRHLGETFLHEYGHAIDGAKWFGLKGRITPFIYPFTHYSTEVAANNEALKLLDKIVDPNDRELAKKLFNKGQAENLGVTKLLRPVDYTAGVTGIAGGIGGGYLGWRTGKYLGHSLYDSFNRNKRIYNEEDRKRNERWRNITGYTTGTAGAVTGAKWGNIMGRLGGMYAGNQLIIKPNIKWYREQSRKIPRLTAAENEQLVNILRRVVRK